MPRVRFLVAAGIAAVILIATAGHPQATKTDTKLPDPVAKTFKKAFPKGEIQKVDSEDENGVTVYDFEFKEGDTEKETDIAADGTMLEFTVVVAADAVPAAAMKSISVAAQGATIERLEHIEIQYEIKDGRVVKLPKVVTHYAAEMAKGKQRAEIVVKLDGAVVDPAKWDQAEVEPGDKPKD